jgi:hypothetical protein
MNKALEESIFVWQNRRDRAYRSIGMTRLEAHIHFGADSCPLCQVYHERFTKNSDCNGCPIKEHTGKHFCQDTVYDKLTDTREITEQNVVLFDEMVTFLESLR